MLPIHAEVEVEAFGIEVVKDCICVGLVRGRKYDYLHACGSLLQALHQIGSYIDTSANSFFVGKVNLEKHVGILALNIVNAMNQCFVHVKDEYLFKRTYR